MQNLWDGSKKDKIGKVAEFWNEDGKILAKINDREAYNSFFLIAPEGEALIAVTEKNSPILHKSELSEKMIVFANHLESERHKADRGSGDVYRL